MKNVRSEERVKVNSTQVDYKGTLKVSEALKVLQNLAVENGALVGLYPDDFVGKYGWVLVNQTLTFHKDIHEYDEVVFATRTMGSKGLRFFRYYFIEDLEGNSIGEGFTVWTLIDIEARRIVRPKKVGIVLPEHEDFSHTLESYHPIKDIETSYQETREVRYSNLDTNRHMNNVQYIEWALDAIDYDYLDTRTIDEISMYYIKEMPIHTVTDIYVGYDEDYVKVVFKKDDVTYFETGITFKTA